MTLIDFSLQVARHHGLAGLVLAMVVENLVQVVPSLLLLPLAGFGASRGWYPLPLALLATVVGSLIGCLMWFALGHWLERTLRRGQSLLFSCSQLRRSRRWFRRYGWHVVCWGRLVPVLRTNVSLPAGLELMPLAPFLLASALGVTLWNSVFVLLGYALGRPSLA